MVDSDLGLLGDLAPSAGQARHRHRHRAPRRRGGRSFAALVVVVLMLGGLTGGIWYGGSRVLAAFGNTPDYAGNGAGGVLVQVQPGDTARDIAATLFAKGVVKSAKAFVAAATADPRSRSLQPGLYRLRKDMKATLALAMLLNPTARVLSRVTLPEGLSVAQSLDRIARTTGMALAGLEAAAKNTAVLGLPAFARGRLEGFLYPATYDIEPGTSPTAALAAMVGKFNAVAASTGLEQRAKSAHLDPYQVLIVASLVQKEGRAAADNPKIARVIYNRLSSGVRIDIDASVLYGLGRSGGALSAGDLAKDTPYNVRKIKGLPPTPIASPGQGALNAALAPSSGNWLYYVLMDKQGHHLFTADYNAFLKQKAKSQHEKLI